MSRGGCDYFQFYATFSTQLFPAWFGQCLEKIGEVELACIAWGTLEHISGDPRILAMGVLNIISVRKAHTKFLGHAHFRGTMLLIFGHTC